MCYCKIICYDLARSHHIKCTAKFKLYINVLDSKPKGVSIKVIVNGRLTPGTVIKDLDGGNGYKVKHIKVNYF